MEWNSLAPGLKAQVSHKVEERHLASAAGSGEARVLATPMLVAGIEAAAMAAVKPYLGPGQTTVGTHIDLYHRLATPPGMTVTFEATLERVSPNGRGLRFKASAWDEGGRIGDGVHERVIVDIERFEAKAAARRGG